MKALDIDEPPLDWAEARPNALVKIPEYKEKYVKFANIMEWDKVLGEFMKCTRCVSACKAKGIIEE
jgi:hypothetical protein